jgi:hypothetical protein
MGWLSRRPRRRGWLCVLGLAGGRQSGAVCPLEREIVQRIRDHGGLDGRDHQHARVARVGAVVGGQARRLGAKCQSARLERQLDHKQRADHRDRNDA